LLHILNGESLAYTLAETNVPGERFAFRDVLINGPAPAGLSDDEWRAIRAQHLSEAYGVPPAECESGFSLQQKTLASAIEHDEVVLWFDHDLFCQLNLLYLLNHFANADLGKTRLSLICTGEFLSECNAEQLTTTFKARSKVQSEVLSLASRAWKAYCSPKPIEIETLLAEDTAALPFLSDALFAHLERFPSVRNGLGRIENRGLELIKAGAGKFTQLFPRFQEAESLYGLGDSQLSFALKQLSDAREPLLNVTHDAGNARKANSNQIGQTEFQITEFGKSVARGAQDFIAANNIDLWLGGVQLSPQNLWRWNEQTRSLVY
jgi:hypothetical protein